MVTERLLRTASNVNHVTLVPVDLEPPWSSILLSKAATLWLVSTLSISIARENLTSLLLDI